MKMFEAFINVTIFSYLACIFLTGIGRAPVTNFPDSHQIVGYILAIVVLITSIRTKNSLLKNLCGAAYGFVAMVTFAGNIQWIGGLGAGLSMALWDLGLGVTIFMSDIDK